ncbi:MAG: PAS domain S-box-containing protein [Natronomonas sp.]|jgi:PAS domain S-box-containing protein
MSEQQGSNETAGGSRSGDYSHLVEEAEDGLYMLDGDGNFALLNSAFVALTGYDRGELLGENPRLVLADEEVERLNRQIRSAIASDETSGSMLTTVVTRDGQRKPVEIRFSLLPSENGEYNGLTGVARDIRARRHREQKLEVLSRVLRHNVRNRLNVIFGHAATLKDADDEQYRAAADKIKSAAEELMELSEKARTAQTEVGFNPSDHTQTDVTELIEHLVVQIRREYPDADVKLDLPRELVVNAPSSYRIAINELVENAIEHNPDAEPTVWIRVDQTETAVRTIIEDECPPIPESDRQAINEGEETPLRHSLGIGLWLANWVADTVGGELELNRRPDGGGNCAVLALPYR